MVSVINLQLKPDVFQLHSSHSTIDVNIKTLETENSETQTTHHRPWCSFHPQNLKGAFKSKVKISPSNRDIRWPNDVSNTSTPSQSISDKFHQPKLFPNNFLDPNYVAVISSYYRSELDLSETQLPDKDIRILQLLLKK